MSIIDIRKELHSYIDNNTDETIAAIYALIKNYNNDHKKSLDVKQQDSDIEVAMKEMDNDK